jgi:Na+/proline symporter
VAGLVIAGMLAATMSSVSSGLNSLSTATVVDFWQRFRRRPAAAARDVRTAKAVTLAWGVLVTAPALYLGRFESVVEACLKVIGFFSGPLLGMFLLGVLTRHTNGPGVLLGAAAGTAAAAAAAAADVSYLLYGPVGCAMTMAAGWPLSFCFAPPAEKVLPLTVWASTKEL